MPPKVPRVAGAELRVLQVLWDRQPRAAREVAEALYGSTTSSDIGTVQKLLQRLEAKGLVRRDRSRHVHRFTTTVSRAEFTGRQVEAMADNLTAGSLAPIVMHLVQSRGLSEEERAELHRLLDETPRPKRRGGP